MRRPRIASSVFASSEVNSPVSGNYRHTASATTAHLRKLPSAHRSPWRRWRWSRGWGQTNCGCMEKQSWRAYGQRRNDQSPFTARPDQGRAIQRCFAVHCAYDDGMQDSPTIPPERGGDPASSPTPELSVPRRSGRRRWAIVLGAIVVILLVLLLLAPGIASSSWVRSIVVGKINQSINGRVQIDDWSLSWRGGTQVSGVRLFQNEAQILEMKKLSTDLGVWGVLFGKGYALGKTRVEGLDFVL